MTNKFNREKGDYDYVDKNGKGWRLKKGESLEELKKRARGEKSE
jgi:hypothetical protein